MFVTQANCLR